MRSSKELIQSGDWDNLVILDACRYDFLDHMYGWYPNISEGLEEVRTPGTNTGEFLTKTFPDRYEISVISGTPVINDVSTTHVDKYDDYKPSDHFKRIEQLWEGGWDEEINTCPPQKFRPYNDPPERKIYWFMQPHTPYIGSFSLNLDQGIMEKGEFRKRVLEEYESYFRLVRQAYFFNLSRVLGFLINFLPELEGKTVITSDHGETLGEDGKLGHRPESDREAVRRVPWLEVSQEIEEMDDEEFLEEAYRCVLEREIDGSGRRSRLKLMRKKNVPKHQIIEILVQSEEYSEKFGDPFSICKEW